MQLPVIGQKPEPEWVPFAARPTDGLTLTDRGAVFDLPEGGHAYLISGRPAVITAPPTRTVLTLEPDTDYQLTGVVEAAPMSRTTLYLLEFGERERLATHKANLATGPFRLHWRSHENHQSCRIAFRVAGRGTLRVESMRIVRGRPEPVETTIHRHVEAGKRLLFIAGCARSGTSLMLNMMRCFDDAYCDPVERPFADLAILDRPEAAWVLKRTATCWKTLRSLPNDVGLIYMVRHPFDVLTSRWGAQTDQYVTWERWKAEFDALEEVVTHRAPNTGGLQIVRYEDLVTAPLDVQSRIEGQWELQRTTGFDRFHELASSDAPSLVGVALQGLRPPDRRSIDKWRRQPQLASELRSLVLDHRNELTRFLERFDYDVGSLEEVAHQEPGTGTPTAR